MKKTLPGLLLLAVAIPLPAQGPPADLNATMQAISQALGVGCGYCHTAERGSGRPEPKKDMARAMMTMTREINAKIQEAALQTSPGKAAAEVTAVQCVTCHRGVPVPGQLSDILTKILREKGANAAIDQFRELRKQFYGHQAYDFGEGTLLGLAQALTSGRPDDAIALLHLNLEFNPRSAATYAAISFAYTRKLDDDSAIANLEKALAIEPENGIYQGQLEQLRQFQRAKQRRQ